MQTGAKSHLANMIFCLTAHLKYI